MEYVILFGLLAVLLAIGVPVAFSLLAGDYRAPDAPAEAED